MYKGWVKDININEEENIMNLYIGEKEEGN